MPKTTYILEALSPGEYQIEYQRLDPTDPVNSLDNFTQVHNSDLYTVKVTQGD